MQTIQTSKISLQKAKAKCYHNLRGTQSIVCDLYVIQYHIVHHHCFLSQVESQKRNIPHWESPHIKRTKYMKLIHTSWQGSVVIEADVHGVSALILFHRNCNPSANVSFFLPLRLFLRQKAMMMHNVVLNNVEITYY